jgi:hypothetical protein
LKRLAWPRRELKATATNVDDLYPLLRLGNIAPYENPKAGFGKGGTVGTQAYVRIMAMAYSDDEEGVELTLQEEVL